MAVYIVAQLDVKNTNWQKEYGPALHKKCSLRMLFAYKIGLFDLEKLLK